MDLPIVCPEVGSYSPDTLGREFELGLDIGLARDGGVPPRSCGRASIARTKAPMSSSSLGGPYVGYNGTYVSKLVL